MASAIVAMFANSAWAADALITADRMVDVLDGTVIEQPSVLVVDGRIVEVSTEAITAPAGAARIDLSGHTLMPGLIDMHTQLTSDPTEGGYQSLATTDEDRAITGVKNARRTLLAGFTTVRNVGSRSFSGVALRNAINRGAVPGPRMYVAGIPVGITGGHCSDQNLLPDEFQMPGDGVADGPWAMRAKVRYNIKYGVDLIKTCSTGGVFSKGTSLGAAQGTVEELTAIVDEARMRGLRVAAHAHGTVGIKNAIRAGVSTIEHSSILDEEAIRMAKRAGIYLSMDIYNTEYTLAEGQKNGVLPESLEKERKIGTIQRESFRQAVKAGVKVVFGSDSGVYPHGDNGHQFARMVRFGMSPMQAIQAATSLAAEAIGAQDDVGAIAPGRYGDIVAVQGDPLEDIRVLANVAAVIKAGELIKQNYRSQLP